MSDLIKYVSNGEDVELTPDIVKKYLVSGQGNVSPQEIKMFLELCKYQKLNPFLREVYLIKYSDRSPATMVTGKETFLKRAQNNPSYRGHETGISSDGKTAWAKVYIDKYQVPITCEVDYEEYVARKNDGSPNRMWKEKPKTMLKKCALVHALREAFPKDLGGLYSQEEINTIDSDLSLKTVEIETPKNTEDSKKKALSLVNDCIKTFDGKIVDTVDTSVLHLPIKKQLELKIKERCKETGEKFDAVLKEISLFTVQDGQTRKYKEKWIENIDEATQKWCESSFKVLLKTLPDFKFLQASQKEKDRIGNKLYYHVMDTSLGFRYSKASEITNRKEKLKFYKTLKTYPDIRDKIFEENPENRKQALGIMKIDSEISLKKLNGKKCNELLDIIQEMKNENTKTN